MSTASIRRSSVDYRERIAHLEGHPNFHLHYGDLSDSMSDPARSSARSAPMKFTTSPPRATSRSVSTVPEFTADVDATGVLRVLEAVRLCGLTDTCRIYQASTSELYGKVEEVPQNENTPFHPYSPYAVAKQYGFWIVKEYREAYNMFCCSGILFNHESERRGETFVTRKITLAAARIAQGKQDKLYLGNLSSAARLGLRQGLRRVHVADPAAARSRRISSSPPVSSTRCVSSASCAFRRRGHRARTSWAKGMNEKGIDIRLPARCVIEVSARLLPPDRRCQPLGRPQQGQATNWAGTPPRPPLPNSSSSSWSTHDMKPKSPSSAPSEQVQHQPGRIP